MRWAVLHVFLKRTTSALGGAVALVLPFCCHCPPAPPPPKNTPTAGRRGQKGGRRVWGASKAIPALGSGSTEHPLPRARGVSVRRSRTLLRGPRLQQQSPSPLGLGTLLLLAAHRVGMARGRGTGQLASNIYSHLRTRKVSEVQSKTEFRGVSGNSRAAYAKLITKIL